MGELVADFVLKRLREWGVHRIYGYPGQATGSHSSTVTRLGTASSSPR